MVHLSNWQPVSDIDPGSPPSPRLRTSPLPRLKTTMFQDVPPAKMSVRRRILLMSIVFTVGNLALTLNKSSRVYLFEQARCLIYYQVNDSTKIDSENGVNESLCKLEGVQHPLSVTVGIDAILSMLPGKVSMSYPFNYRAITYSYTNKAWLQCCWSLVSISSSWPGSVCEVLC